MTVQIYTPVSYSTPMPDLTTSPLKDAIRKSANDYAKALRNHEKSKSQNKDLKTKSRKYDSDETGDNVYSTRLGGLVTVIGSNLHLAQMKLNLESAKDSLKSDAEDITNAIDDHKSFLDSIKDALEEIGEKIYEADENMKDSREKLNEIRAELKALGDDEDTDQLEGEKESILDDIELLREYKLDAMADVSEKEEDREKAKKCIGKLQEIYKMYYTLVLKKRNVDVEDNIVEVKPKVKVEVAVDEDDDEDEDDDDDDDDDIEHHVENCSKDSLIDKLLKMLTKNKTHAMNTEVLKACLKKCLKISEDLEKKTGHSHPLTKLLHSKLHDAITMCE
jgi:hypothetical protein